MASSMDGFEDLLERAEKLSSSINREGFVAPISRIDQSLNQVFEAGERLWHKTVASGHPESGIDENTSLLGARSSVLPSLPQVFDAQKQGASKKPTQTLQFLETDLEAFLKNEEENALLSIIEESISSTFESVQRKHWDIVLSGWAQQKQKLFNAIPSLNFADACKRPVTASFLDQTASFRKSPMSDVEIAFAQKIIAFTDKIVQGGTRPKLADIFLGVSRTFKDPALITMWEQVAHVLDVPIQPGRDLALQRAQPQFAVACITQALRYLEKQFREHMQSVVRDNLAQAKAGGEPGLIALIVAYLNVKLPTEYPGHEDGTVHGHPVWALVYCCLRVGSVEAALQIIQDSGQQLASFGSILAELHQSDCQRLSSDSEANLRLAYQRSVKRSQDPFKRVVYSILGSCDVSAEHPEVCDKLEDWFWVRLHQARLSELSAESVAYASSLSQSASKPDRRSGPLATPGLRDNLSLLQLQKLILEDYGEAHFCAGSRDNPFLYFSALWLTGQFESAVDFLCRQSDAIRCHAVHIALAAYQMGVLIVPSDSQAKLCAVQSGDPPGIKRLNFARLLMMYVSKFEISDPKEALNYLYFLRDFKTPKGENLFLSCVSNMVLQTHEFELILGKIEPDGCRTPGLIDKFSLHYNIQKMIEFIALESENRGLQDDALKLYDLAGRHSKVLEILSSMISQVASQQSISNSLRDRVSSFAHQIATRYATHGHTAPEDVSSTFFLMMDLLTFFDLYHAKRYADALEVVRKLKLLPLHPNDVDTFINNFHLVPEHERRLLGGLLLAVMSILHQQCKEIAAKPGLISVSANVRDAIADLRASAQAILLCAGRIPYRLPGDVNARLIQLDSYMSSDVGR